MKICALLLLVSVPGVAQAQTTATHKTAPKKKVTARRTPVKRAVATPHQASPTQDRYKEIQTALAAKGYLKTEPSGLWDANSMDAMRRYQTDQKQEATGKLTAASLIGLGLGPKTASMTTANVRPAEVPEPPVVVSAPVPQP